MRLPAGGSVVNLFTFAVAVRLLIPAFAVQGAPGILGTRLPQEYAKALDAAHCAQPTPVDQLGPQTAQAIEQCEGNHYCIGHLAQVAGYDQVLLGWVTKLDDRYVVALKLIEAPSGNVKKSLEMVHPQTLKTIPTTIASFAPTICRELDPAWVDTTKATLDASLSDLDFDPGSPLVTAATAPTATVPPPTSTRKRLNA